MSAIFQRPLCEMGAAYDYAFRPVVGAPDPTMGGPCDDRPRAVRLIADPAHAPPGGGRQFSLCPEHEGQLRTVDGRLTLGGTPSRFASAALPTSGRP